MPATMTRTVIVVVLSALSGRASVVLGASASAGIHRALRLCATGASSAAGMNRTARATRAAGALGASAGVILSACAGASRLSLRSSSGALASSAIAAV